MGSSIISLIVKISILLFVFLCVFYFVKADSWLSNHDKIAGIILVTLLIIMIAGILAGMMIVAK